MYAIQNDFLVLTESDLCIYPYLYFSGNAYFTRFGGLKEASHKFGELFDAVGAVGQHLWPLRRVTVDSNVGFRYTFLIRKRIIIANI